MSLAVANEAKAKRKLTHADYERYLPLVRRTAMKLSRRLPSHVTVADLISATGLGQSLVSHHLRTLRDAELVITRREGRWIFYSLSKQALASTKLVLYDLG